MINRPRVALTLLSALFILSLPASASAATYTVDSVFDQADEPGAGCVTSENTCTLRAAIEVANSSAGEKDAIIFSPTVFEGQSSDSITPGSALPAITSPVEIISGSCARGGGVFGPCAGVEGPSGATVLTVEADNSSISGLQIAGGAIGIGVFGASTGFTATGNWIGFGLNGGGGSTTAGIFLDPGSDGATIGGDLPAQRNIVSYSGVGLDIEGASDAVVRGNWFGMQPDGVDIGAAGTNIEITNLKPLVGEEFKAEDNEIGAVLSEGAQETAACDGGCNVISAATSRGIDLVGAEVQGETPASGPTVIHGNYVGLNPAGTEAVESFTYKGNGQFGILTGGSSFARVGGIEPGEENLIVGGVFGIYGENGEQLDVAYNEIGFAADGDPVAAPTEAGIFAFALELSDFEEGPTILGNAIRMEAEQGIGIEHRFGTASIIENTIEGGSFGILTKGAGVVGTKIEDNLIEGSDESGIRLENPDNEVFGNEIIGVGEMGIEVDPGAEIDVSGNVIGGDSPQSENKIFDSGAYAILIRGIEESRNEVRRNRGSGNSDVGFIVLRPYNPSGGDPNGVDSPTISAAAKTEASGSAEPGAVVRVFWKASSDEGELAGFLGQAVANGSGQWKATYPPQPEGTRVVATQTLDGGTSSLSQIATTPPDPPVPGGGGVDCPAAGASCPPPPVVQPPKPPNTKIVKGPAGKITKTTVVFKFRSLGSSRGFQCKLDKGKFKNCKSPKTYKKLKPGKHVFRVRAVDKAGNVGKAAKRKFTVVASS
ncbi:MAG TPA: right-handed parallel beta-helix repeat-containing protein [Solirubrobacterales bacterium]